MNPKPKRIKDRDFLDFIRTIPCIVCGSLPSEGDHLTTRKAGGHDVANNVWPLCRREHTERHKIGLLTFIKKYPACRTWLELAGRTDILDKLK